MKKSAPIPKEQRRLLWEDDRQRKWNIGFTSNGISISQQNGLPSQTAALFKYREFTIVPRINYWVNQAVMIGMQGTYYHYENNYDLIVPNAHGYGLGLQSRFYPLSFWSPDKFIAVRIDKRANLVISPIVGVEVHVANYSWLDPHSAGDKWQYYDFQPYAGFVLSYKRRFSLTWSVGPIISADETKLISPVNGVRIVGLEYSFLKYY